MTVVSIGAVVACVVLAASLLRRLRRLNEELERRVEERTADLAAANAELQAFAHAVSHDLRTPVRALDGFSQALLEDYGDDLDERARHYLTRIRAASQRMGGLIDDVLRLSRVTRADLSRRRVDVTALVLEVADELAAGQPGRRVEVDVEAGLSALADEQLLRAVFQNLLENAWKFTRPVAAPRIEVRASRLGGAPGFTVADNGVGFENELAAKLFRPFQRLHPEAEFEGHGIGLAIVLDVVQRHGGTVRADSPAGGGARFAFTLGGAGGPPLPAAADLVGAGATRA